VTERHFGLEELLEAPLAELASVAGLPIATEGGLDTHTRTIEVDVACASRKPMPVSLGIRSQNLTGRSRSLGVFTPPRASLRFTLIHPENLSWLR